MQQRDIIRLLAILLLLKTDCLFYFFPFTLVLNNNLY